MMLPRRTNKLPTQPLDQPLPRIDIDQSSSRFAMLRRILFNRRVSRQKHKRRGEDGFKFSLSCISLPLWSLAHGSCGETS